jgi:hypothetical protein
MLAGCLLQHKNSMLGKGRVCLRQLCAILKGRESGPLGRGVLTLRVKHILSFPGQARETRHVLKAKLASVVEGLSSNITLLLACNLRLVKAAEGFTQCLRRLCHITAHIVYYFIILCIAILIFLDIRPKSPALPPLSPATHLLLYFLLLPLEPSLTSPPYLSGIRDPMISIMGSPSSLPTRFNSLAILRLHILFFMPRPLLLKRQLLDLRPGTQIGML